MQKDKMKVFHGLVNYGTQAGMLTKGLREKGIEAYSVSIEDSFSRLIDETITFSDSWWVRRFQTISLFFKKINWMFHYNVFHFYFGRTLFRHDLDLYFYRFLRKKVVMEYLGTDCHLWLGLNGLDWRGRPVNRRKIIKKIERQANLCDKQLVCAPVYYEEVDNSTILPLALDLSKYSYLPYREPDIIKFLHCPTNRKAKKSDYIEAALGKLKSEGYNFIYKCVTNVSHEQLIREYEDSDVVIDQLNEWYGTVSVEAMALGKPVVAGYYPHLCHYDKRFENLPIINADIYNIYNVLKDILNKKYDLKTISEESREFVMRTHDLSAVTEQLTNIYQNL